jgi:hypothetical protein
MIVLIATAGGIAFGATIYSLIVRELEFQDVAEQIRNLTIP